MTERLFRDINLAKQIQSIQSQIEEECIRLKRSRKEIQVMAVSKKIAPEMVNFAFQQGIDLIGENRVQEFLSKKELYDFGKENIHFIGSLQSNKVKEILPFIDTIQSLDSVNLAQKINAYSAKINQKTKCLVEVNICKEPNKGGIFPANLEGFLQEISVLEQIEITGLMTIGQDIENIQKKEEIFHAMHSLFVDIGLKKIDNVCMRTLSMGMSKDYLLAIKHGATIVRLGSALFGK